MRNAVCSRWCWKDNDWNCRGAACAQLLSLPPQPTQLVGMAHDGVAGGGSQTSAEHVHGFNAGRNALLYWDTLLAEHPPTNPLDGELILL